MGTWNDADSAGEFYKSRAYGTDTTACRWPRWLGDVRRWHRSGSGPACARRQCRTQTPSATTGHPPAATPRLEGTDDSPLSSVDATETRPGADRDRSSSVHRRANAIQVYNTTAEARATFPRRFWPPANRSWRSTRRKCAHRRTVPSPRDRHGTCRRGAGRTACELNPTCRLCVYS
jgi:hypothetical protein